MHRIGKCCRLWRLFHALPQEQSHDGHRAPDPACAPDSRDMTGSAADAAKNMHGQQRQFVLLPHVMRRLSAKRSVKGTAMPVTCLPAQEATTLM